MGQVMGDAYVEISPSDPEYSRLARQAVSEEELDARRQEWRDGDEALRREFERYLVSQGLAGPQAEDAASGPGAQSPG